MIQHHKWHHSFYNFNNFDCFSLFWHYGCNNDLYAVFQLLSYSYQRLPHLFVNFWGKNNKDFYCTLSIIRGYDHLSLLHLICIFSYGISGQCPFDFSVSKPSWEMDVLDLLEIMLQIMEIVTFIFKMLMFFMQHLHGLFWSM